MQLPADDYMTQKEVAALLNLSHRALEAWRSRDYGPKFIRISTRCIRYRRSDVNAWLEQNQVKPEKIINTEQKQKAFALLELTLNPEITADY